MKRSLFICLVVISLIAIMSFGTIKANEESIDERRSPVVVPFDKIDSVKLLINDIEYDLNENDTDVVAELTSFKMKCEDLLETNLEESENLEKLIVEIEEIVNEFNVYKLNEKMKETFDVTYSSAIAAIAAGFLMANWELSAELLLHARYNNDLNSVYYPTFGKNITYTQTFNDLVNDNTISGSKEFNLNFQNLSHHDEDAYFALHWFKYQKMYHSEGKINIIINDRYDYNEDTGSGLQASLVNLCYDAQQAGVLVPYFSVINYISEGSLPFKYSINGNNIIIDKYIDNNPNVKIPSKIENHNLFYLPDEPFQHYVVKSISQNAFKDNNFVESVELPNSVTNIDSSAFENCSYLQSVTLPSNLVSIGTSAFKGCGSLGSITIPNSVTSIGTSVFENCSYLQSVTLPTNLVSIGTSAFKGCGSLGSITIPNSVTHIDSSAFENCSYLQSVTLPTNLVSIGISTFKGCGSLGSITIPSSIQYIDDSAFENCVSLVSVVVEREISNITNLGDYVFAGCSSSLQIIVPLNRVAEYKNKESWSNYKNRIITNDDNFSEIELHCLSDFYNLTSLEVNYKKLYKLNVLCGKSYQIITDSNSDVKINLYDSNMNLISSHVNSLMTYLGVNTYYIDMELDNASSSEIITTTFELRWENNGERIYYNDEHNLLTHLHKISNSTYLNKLYYVNDNGAGFYKLQISGNVEDGSSLSTQLGNISIYNDSGRKITQLLNKYPNSDDYAITDYGQDIMYVYLPRNGYFYIDVLMPTDNYDSLYLTISQVDIETINLISDMTSTFIEDLTTDNNQKEYARKIIINQTSKYSFDINSSDALSDNFNIVFFKQTYNSSSNSYYTNFELIDFIVDTSTQKAFEVSLDAGIYFIYYYNNDTNVDIDLTMTRILQNNSNRVNAMQADPVGSGYNPGSEVRFNNGSRNNYSITEGFTRNMYFVLENFYTYSRLDFDWYSSNEGIATVSEFGTVFANNVSSNQTVTIYAVYKEDPSLIYYRTFTIVNDTSEEEINITCNMSYSYSEENGTYQIELNDSNSPYPWIQYYNWSIYVPCQENDIACNMSMWGEITASGPGYATLTGTYIFNPRVTIIIYLTIIE